MSKEKEVKEVVESPAKVKNDRELRWEKLLEVYAKQNPAKFEEKKKAGKFDKIPASFN